MAEVKFQKGSEEWLMFQDYYKIIQKYYIPESNDSYWDDVVEEMDGKNVRAVSIKLDNGITTDENGFIKLDDYAQNELLFD